MNQRPILTWMTPANYSGDRLFQARTKNVIQCSSLGNFLLRHKNSIICLIRPPAVEAFRFASSSINLPLGLAYIAGALRGAGFSIEVVDAIAEAPDERTKY